MSHHKDEALRVLRQVAARLADPRPVDRQEQFRLRADVDYVIAETVQIEELKIARKRPRATVAEPAPDGTPTLLEA